MNDYEQRRGFSAKEISRRGSSIGELNLRCATGSSRTLRYSFHRIIGTIFVTHHRKYDKVTECSKRSRVQVTGRSRPRLSLSLRVGGNARINETIECGKIHCKYVYRRAERLAFNVRSIPRALRTRRVRSGH